MKRVLSLVLVLMLVLGTIMPAFAETAVTVSTETQDLADYGVIAGDGNGYNESGELNRAEFTVLLAALNGMKATAGAYELPTTFTDLTEGAWYVPYVAYADHMNWMSGDPIQADGSRNFRPDATMTAQEVNAMYLKVLGYDVPWGEVNAKAADLGIAVVAANDGAVLRGEAFVGLRMTLDKTPVGGTAALGTTLPLVGYEAPVVEGALTIASVEASKVNTLVVTFNKAVDTADYTLAVKKGTASVSAAAATWNADKTVATIVTTAKMTNGNYTVTATSAAELAADATYTGLSAMTEIVSQYVKEIVLLNDVALTGKKVALDHGQAYVYYDILDQYGESVRTSTSVTWSSSATVANDNRSKGMLTFERSDGNAFTYGEKIYVTGVYTKTGVTITGEVSIASAQALNTVDVAGFIKKGTVEILSTLPAGFAADTYYMIYTVQDQNGNPMEVTDPIANDKVTFISDNVLVIKELVEAGETVVTIDGDEYNAVFVTPGISVGKGGEATITAIANKTGNKTNLNVAVGEDSILSSFTLLSPVDMISDGSDVEIPFEAYDQNGNAMTNFVNLAKQETFNTLTFTTSAGTVILSEKADGTAILEYVDDAMAWTDSQATNGIDRTVSITSVVVGGDTSSELIYIQDKARPDAISGVGVNNVLVEQDSDTVKLKDIDFLDQYGRTINDAKSKAFFDATRVGTVPGSDFLGYTYSVRSIYKGDNGYFADSAAAAIVTNQEIEIYANTTPATEYLTLAAVADTVESSKAGFAVKFEIVRTKTGFVNAQATSTTKTETFTVVDVTAVKNYEVADLDKFYVNTSNSAAANGDTAAVATMATTVVAANVPATHEQDVEVSGTFNGESVDIPALYLSVNGGKLDTTAGAQGDVTIDTVDLADFTWADLYDENSSRYVRQDADDTIKVTVYNTSGAGFAVRDVLSAKVAISDEEPEATTFVADDSDYDATREIQATTTVIASPTYAVVAGEAVITVDGEEYYLYDQYGIDYITATVTFRVSSVVETEAGYAENNFSIAGNDTAAVTISGAERGDTYVLTVTADNVTKEIEVTVGADNSANITDSTNNYLDVLIGDGTDGALENQRTDGLN